MKNLKKIALGLMVGGMAIGFSAFTNAPKKSHLGTTTDRYYNNNGGVATTDPSKFIYEGSDNCVTDPSSQCSVEWTTANAPTLGQTPSQAGSPSIVSGSAQPGDPNF
jgi:hypothetical protein